MAFRNGFAALLALLSAAASAMSGARAAPVTCVAVQVNEGQVPPPVEAYSLALPKGGCVRDLLGWQQVERANGVFTLPPKQEENFHNVAAAGMRNLVTLGFGNTLHGSDKLALPQTPDDIQAFARYAAWVVGNDGGSAANARAANIPNLYAVSIWNELNGTWNGGISNPERRVIAYAALVNAVAPVIRRANPNVKIIIGATVGTHIAEWFKTLFLTAHSWGLNDPEVYLDVHPYIGEALRVDKPVVPGLVTWNEQMAKIRAAGIRNALFATEWGSFVATKAEANNAGLDYIGWMQANVFAHEDFAGTAWFEMMDFGKFGHPALVSADGGTLARTKLGDAFVRWWRAGAPSQGTGR